MRVTRRLTAAAFGTMVAFATIGGAAAAHAENTAVQHPDYVAPPPSVLGEVVSAPAVEPAQTTVSPANTGISTLPITGDDSAGLVVVGLGMLGVGAVLVRRNRRTA